MLKAQNLEISKICPSEIQNLNIKIVSVDITPDTQKQWIRGVQLKSKKEKWCSNFPPDVKRIKAILNKLTEENYHKLLEETKTFNYSDPQVVTIIFKKIIADPFYCNLYSKFCKDLVGLHDLIPDMCIEEFNVNRHVNLARFIGELYKIDLIFDLNSYVEILLEDLTEQNLEVLCKIIVVIGVTNPIFEEIINYLGNVKNKFNNRHRFMIMDIIDNCVKNVY